MQFINSETDENFIGNPFLINSQINNFDARLEWYFDRSQFITAGFFFKDLENPIEEVGASSIDSPINTFINAPAATILGFEVEGEADIPLHDWLGWDWLARRDFSFTANYTYTDSEVSADGVVQNAMFNAGEIELTEIDASSFIIDGRSLQGQSDHIFNFSVGYDDEEAGSSLRLLFNFASDRIRTTESLVANQPAIIESPPLSLDLNYLKRFSILGSEYQFGLNIRNLTSADYDARQSGTENTIVVDSFERGTEFLFSLKKSF